MPHLVEISLRELANVFAAIPVFGKRRVLAQDLLRARAHRHREILDLLARVVVVELARHLRPLPFEQRGDGITQRGLPAVADVERAGRVRGHELDHDAFTVAHVAAAEALASGENFADDSLARRRGEKEIDESRARDFRPGEPVRRR